jgi:hypothetical protein
MRRRRTLVLALAATAVAAGCLGASPLAEEAGVDEAGADGSVPGPGAFLEPVNVSTDWPGAEPVVDVGPDGTTYVEGVGFRDEPGPLGRGVNKVFRSVDGGATWTDVTPPGPGQEETGDGYVAVGPNGDVFAANVFELTFQVFRSSDHGETWTPLNVPRIPALMHRHWIEPMADGTVHVTVEALAPDSAARIFGPGAPSTPPQANKGFYYFRSDDGGDTWTTPTRIDPQVNFAGQSNMAVGPDGERLYVARYEEDEGPPLEYGYEEGHWYLLASEDGGDSWERREMFDLDAPLGDTIPTIRVDGTGTIYFMWAEVAGGTSTVHLATSDDGGETWTRNRLLEERATYALPWFDVRAPGVLEMAAYATTGGEGPPGGVDASWGVDAARVTGAGTDDPRAEARRITDWSVHEGTICVKGPACEAETRSLLDYLWVEMGPRDRPHLAFASTRSEDVSAFPVFSRGVGTGS